MEQNVINILENQFDRLPESLQTFIISDEFKENLRNIGSNHNLDDKKQTDLENETLMVLLGIKPFTELRGSLIQDNKLTQEQAQDIMSDVFEKIITPIEEDLRTFLEKELQEESEEETKVRDIPSVESEGSVNTEEMKRLLRENSKTTSIKNLIANLK